jgi:hypothetical protein
MKVVLTQRFKDEYLKPLLKYFTKEDLVRHLKERNHKFISLHYPYFKLKNKINNFSIRWVLAVIQDERIIPLMIFTKKDKNYWDNIRWESYKKFIIFEYETGLEDIENWEFEEF